MSLALQPRKATVPPGAPMNFLRAVQCATLSHPTTPIYLLSPPLSQKQIRLLASSREESCLITVCLACVRLVFLLQTQRQSLPPLRKHCAPKLMHTLQCFTTWKSLPVAADVRQPTSTISCLESSAASKKAEVFKVLPKDANSS